MPRSLRTAAVTLAVAATVGIGLVVVGGVVGKPSDGPGPIPAADSATSVDRLDAAISRSQDQLRRVPGDWATWASLSVAYLEKSRVTADPSWYPKAEEAALKSLAVKPTDNPDALVAQGALANARHDFAVARDQARAALAINAYHSEAFAVLADAETQLGNRSAATDAIQRLLDLRPGLSAYARASYDLELRGLTTEATDLMRRALDASVGRSDIAFCRTQLGDLAFNTGDLDAADAEYKAGLAAEPTSVALQRGRARVSAAQGRLDAALTAYATLTSRAPTPDHLIEYAELLRLAGRPTDAEAQLRLASAAHQLFLGNGGVDGLTGAALAEANGDPAGAVTAAQGEWKRRQHADVADTLAWALHLSQRDSEALTIAQTARATGARSATYSYHLGMIELALGDRASARTHLNEALAINPYFSPTLAPAARQTLAGLGA
jgi:tetratricopeptide (TPR) repeat protein